MKASEDINKTFIHFTDISTMHPLFNISSSNASHTNITINASVGNNENDFHMFEQYVRIIIPIIFGLIVLLGLVGNLLVICVIIMNQQMRSTTNILILNLAVADLCFIIFCVPYTAVAYALPIWPFGVIWCKIVQYLMYVCAYASVYTLVVMSLDRFLAVVHPISSMSYRTQSNTVLILIIVWLVILLLHIPLLIYVEEYSFVYEDEYRSTCVNKKSVLSKSMAKLFFGSFFLFGYILPLSFICVLYGFMLKRLLYGVVPGGSHVAKSARSKKRVTKMVVIVVVIFALCWLPIQIIFMMRNFGTTDDSMEAIAIQMVSNCLAYMNSCVNPILYAFLSDNFRRSFRRLLCCGADQYTKFGYERTNIKIEKTERPNPPMCASANVHVNSTTTLQNYNNTDNGIEAVNHFTQTDV